MTKQNNTKRGFTLLELLVVIGIIAILVSLITVGYSRAQMGGRDAKRRQDLRSIQSAMEQYYSANSYSYPVCNNHTNCSAYLNSYFSSGNLPVDPLSTPGSTYVYNSTAAGYTITATLERDGTPISVSSLQ
jgi:prepilin-type N-terminal cleavage/methylation domain-containing protein